MRWSLWAVTVGSAVLCAVDLTHLPGTPAAEGAGFGLGVVHGLFIALNGALTLFLPTTLQQPGAGVGYGAGVLVGAAVFLVELITRPIRLVGRSAARRSED
jgi:hypothetical protein